jgi:hypothetical protein
MFVLDPKEHDVKVFDARGRFVRRFGRQGAGPGELTGPAFRLQVTDSTVEIADRMLRRDVVFTHDGRHVRTASHPPSPADGPPMDVYTPRRGWTLVVSPPNARVASQGGRMVMAGDPFTRLVLHGPAGRRDTLGAIRAGLAEAEIFDGKRQYTVTYEQTGAGDAGAFAIHRDSLLALVDGLAGTVRWIAVGERGPETRRTERIAPGGGALSAAEARALARGIEERRRPRMPNVRVELSNLPPRSSVARALFANDGALWIATPPERGAVRWTVFPVRGEAFTVALPATLTLTAVQGNRLYGYGEDADELPAVIVYELRPD